MNTFKSQQKIQKITTFFMVFAVVATMLFSNIPLPQYQGGGQFVLDSSVPTAEAAWYDTNYQYCRVLTIDNTKVATTTTNGFALFFSTTTTSLAATSSSGKVEKLDTNGLPVDVVYTSGSTCSGGGALLNFYHEDYSSTTGKIDSWVEVTDLSSTTDKTVLMYYGNTSATDVSNEAGTWGGLNERAVWNLNEDPGTAGIGGILDSTSYNNDGTDNGSMTSADSVTGIAGKSLDFDGTNDYIDMTDVDYATGGFSIGAWVKTTASTTVKRILSKFNSGTNQIGLFADSDGGMSIGFNDGTGWIGSSNASQNWQDGTWRYVVGVVDTSNSTIYVDGNAGTSVAHDNAFPTNNNNWTIGSRAGTAEYFNGTIDEARLYDRALTQADITTIYNNTNSPSTFWSAGVEEVSEWNATDWTLYDTITVKSSAVSNDLTDFPVYVDLSDLSSQFWSTTPSASSTVGTDIRVTTDGGSPVELPRELVSASSTAQTGELHFKANSISSTTDTVFRIYYNGSTAGDYATNATYGAQNVWLNYDFVSHDGGITDVSPTGIIPTNSGSSLTTTTKLGGEARSFTEETNSINIADNSFKQIASYITYTAWLQKSVGGNGPDIIFEEGGGTAGFEGIYRTSPNQYSVVAGNNNVDTELAQTGSITEGSYSYVAFQFVAGELRLYVNGTLNATSSFASTTIDSHTGSAGIGAVNGTDISTSGTNGYDGLIDEIRRRGDGSNDYLSAAWISAEYTNQNLTTDFYTVASNGVVPTITLSGTLYSDEGATQITSGKTIKLAVGTTTTSVQSTTTDSGAGTFSFTVPQTYLTATNTPIAVWVDGSATVKAVTVSRLASTTADVTGVDLYQNHVIVRHEGTDVTAALTTADMAFYDGDDDSDIQFTASSTQTTALTVNAGNELYVWPNKTFVPIGGVVINGDAGSGVDGSFELAGGAGYYGASSSLSIAGNLTMTTSSTFVPHTGGITFTATTTGKTITATIASTTYQSLGDVTFNGSGGGWTINADATTTSLTITNGSVAVSASSNLTVLSNYTNNGTFTNSGTINIGPSEGFDFNTAVYSGSSYDLSGQETNGRGMDFSPNGKKLYIVGNGGVEINEYSLSTPWDVSSRTATDFFSVSGQTSIPYAVAVTPDGKWIYVGDESTKIIYKYALTTPWDLTTVSYTSTSYTATEPATLYDIQFSSDGTKLYLLDANSDNIYTYDVSIPWDITSDSVTYSHQYSVTAQETDPQSFDFNVDGTQLYVIGRTGDDVNVYDLSTPWDISTSSISFVSAPLSVLSQTTQTRGMRISGDGTKMNLLDNASVVYEYTLDQSAQSLSGTLTGSSALGNTTINSTATTTFSNNASTTDLTINNGTTTAPNSLSVAGNFSNTGVYESPADSPLVVSGNFTNNSGAVFTPGKDSGIKIAGNYTNNGTYTSNTDTVTFNGTSQQTATGTMTGSNAFSNLTVSNTSGNGTTTQSVIFGAAASTTGTFTMVASTSVQFLASTTYTFQNINWTGGSSTAEVWLRSSGAGTSWLLNVPGTQESVRYVNVQDSNATSTIGGIDANDSTDVSGNTNWNFFTTVPWNNTDWTEYVAITIDNTKIDDDLTNFPVYVDLADMPDTFWNTVADGGGDIRVTTHTGTPVELAREVVSASTTAQTGELYFKADAISSTTDTIFRIYYNGSTTVSYVDAATYGAENVWNDYNVVWHMNSLTQPDSAGNMIDRAVTGGFTDPTLTSGGDISMDANDEMYVYGDLGSYSDWSSIVYWSDTGATNAGRNQVKVAGYGRFEVQSINPVGGTVQVRSGGGSQTTINGPASTTNPQMLVATFDSTSGIISTYSNGIFVASTTGAVPSDNWNGWSVYRMQGTNYESRGAPTNFSAAYVKAMYENYATTTTFYSTSTITTGTTTLAESDAGQVSDAFNFQNKTNEPLYTFKMTPATENATITAMTFNLTGAQNVSASDFSNLRLYRDMDSDGAYDVTDIQVGGAGSMSISGQAGTVSFTGDFSATTSQNFVIIADWNAPSNGSFMTVGLSTDGVTSVGVTSLANMQILGSVSTIQHSRNDKGGGGSSAAVGGAAPAGDGVVSGGTNQGGEQIGGSPGFQWPTTNSGSWTTPANAYDQTDGTYATAASALTHNFANHGFSIQGTNQIDGIEVKLEISGTTAAGNIGVELSWDGGTTYTTSGNTTPTLTTTDAVVVVGSPSDTWGRSWSPSEFSDGSFEVRLTGNPSSNTVQVDAIQVKIYNSTTGGGGGGGGAI